MVASTETLDALKSIGLNLYERKIYVALLAKGVATAAELSELADVPRSRSYDVLESLADKGFVVVQPSKPIKYVGLKPEEALEKTKDKIERDHQEMRKRIDRLKKSEVVDELKEIHQKGLNLMQPGDMTGTLKGRHNINRHLRTLFKKAEEEINIMTTRQGLNDLYSNHHKTLKRLTNKGTKLRILAPLENNSAVKAFSQIAELKHLEEPKGRFCLVDDDHLIMALTDDNKVHETQDLAFWANSEHATGDVMSHFFHHLWKTSSEFERE